MSHKTIPGNAHNSYDSLVNRVFLDCEMSHNTILKVLKTTGAVLLAVWVTVEAIKGGYSKL